MDIRGNVFISYSRQDASFVDSIEAILVAQNYRVWVDRSQLEGGQRWEREIHNAINLCEIFLLIVSPNSARSLWVRREIAIARKSKRCIVLGLLSDTVDAAGGDQFAVQLRHLRAFNQVDFRPEYQAGLANLAHLLLSLTPQIKRVIRGRHMRLARNTGLLLACVFGVMFSVGVLGNLLSSANPPMPLVIFLLLGTAVSLFVWIPLFALVGASIGLVVGLFGARREIRLRTQQVQVA